MEPPTDLLISKLIQPHHLTWCGSNKLYSLYYKAVSLSLKHRRSGSVANMFRGVTKKIQEGHNSLGAEWIWVSNYCRGCQKFTTISLFSVHMLPKDLRFEHGSTKLASCPRRHLTSLCPWIRFRSAVPMVFSSPLTSLGDLRFYSIDWLHVSVYGTSFSLLLSKLPKLLV